jgi:uncharacterized membrane protein HdeD (DUF308 family)
MVVIRVDGISPVNLEKKEAVMAIAALILGILGLVCFFFPPLAIVCAVLAIIFGALRLKSARRGLALAGLIMGIIAIAGSILVLIFGFALFSSASTGF